MEILKDRKWYDHDIEGVLYHQGNDTVEILIEENRSDPAGSILLTADDINEFALAVGIKKGGENETQTKTPGGVV